MREPIGLSARFRRQRRRMALTRINNDETVRASILWLLREDRKSKLHDWRRGGQDALHLQVLPDHA